MKDFIMVTLLLSIMWLFVYNFDDDPIDIYKSRLQYIKELKSRCEQHLPRNQECTMVFIAPEKPSNDKTKG